MGKLSKLHPSWDYLMMIPLLSSIWIITQVKSIDFSSGESQRLERDIMGTPHSNKSIWYHSQAASKEQHSMLPEKQNDSSFSTGSKKLACKELTLEKSRQESPLL